MWSVCMWFVCVCVRVCWNDIIHTVPHDLSENTYILHVLPTDTYRDMFLIEAHQHLHPAALP